VSYECIVFDVKDGVARLTLNRPERLNSFNTQMHAEVREALLAIPGSGARVLVISGAGRGFCAGQDLNDRAVAPGGATPDLADSIEKYYAAHARNCCGQRRGSRRRSEHCTRL
jgi:2-(1,2-epoxy-1,2-dihydrophenyl)acetyl-CoA isomerase